MNALVTLLYRISSYELQKKKAALYILNLDEIHDQNQLFNM